LRLLLDSSAGRKQSSKTVQSNFIQIILPNLKGQPHYMNIFKKTFSVNLQARFSGSWSLKIVLTDLLLGYLSIFLCFYEISKNQSF